MWNCIDYLLVSKWTLASFCALALSQVLLDFFTVRGRRWCVLSHLRKWQYDKPRGRGCSQIEFICNNLFPSQQQMPGNQVHAISGEQLSLSNEKSQRRLWKTWKRNWAVALVVVEEGTHCEEVFFSPFLSSGYN